MNSTAPSAKPAASPGLIVIGASAGAIEALSALLPGLPVDYPLPILVVVHSPPHRDSVIAKIFQAKCRLPVKQAEDKEFIAAGVYFAPPDYHLLVEPDHSLALSGDDPVCFSRPSIDVLFGTAADVYGPSSAAVILTGGNADGAKGLAAICAAGGLGIVQDPKEAQFSTMPLAALNTCPAARRLTLPGIADWLLHLPTPPLPHLS